MIFLHSPWRHARNHPGVDGTERVANEERAGASLPKAASGTTGNQSDTYYYIKAGSGNPIGGKGSHK